MFTGPLTMSINPSMNLLKIPNLSSPCILKRYTSYVIKELFPPIHQAHKNIQGNKSFEFNSRRQELSPTYLLFDLTTTIIPQGRCGRCVLSTLLDYVVVSVVDDATGDRLLSLLWFAPLFGGNGFRPCTIQLVLAQ